MRIILSFILFCLFLNNVVAQDTLYYFKSDSTNLVGVKDHKGNIIVHPNFPMPDHYNFKTPITSRTIEFYYLPKRQITDYNAVAIPFGAVYNRNGQFLYTPLYYDNGPDYWHEGVRRYVENGKVGLVDSIGNKLTKAKWDMVWPFNEKSQAQVFIGNLKNDYEDGSEHPTVIGHAITYFINTNGDRLTTNKSINFKSKPTFEKTKK